jgi:hypothetical protein
MFLVRLLVLGLIFIAGPALAQSVPSPEFADGLTLCANYPNALCPAGSSPIGLNQAFQQKLNYPTGTQSIGLIPIASGAFSVEWGSVTSAFTAQNANTVFAGPSSGSPAVPTFRTLTVSDLPISGTPSAGYEPIATSATAAAWGNPGCQSSAAFGFVGDGITDNAAAWTAWSSAITGSGCLHFVHGTYLFSTAITKTLASGITSLTIEGDGPEGTVLYWPNSSAGITFTYAGPMNSTHVRDVSFTTAQNGSATGLLLVQGGACLDNFAESTIQRVTFRGSDNTGTVGGNHYWGQAYEYEGVSGSNVDSVQVYGANSTGIGATYVGIAASTCYSIYHNISKSAFLSLGIGLNFGTYSQGETITQTNIQNGVTGIYVPPGAAGLAELVIGSGTQIAMIGGNGVLIESVIADLIVNGADLYGTSGFSAIDITANSAGCVFSGNKFNGSTGVYGLVLTGTTTNTACNVTGNSFQGFGADALVLGSSTAGMVVDGNTFAGNSTSIANSGTGNVITNNPGYNPVGVTNSTTVGTSPATICAGPSPETHYYSQSATNTATVKLGGTGGPQIGETTSGTVVVADLGPNECVYVTWTTTAPTYAKSIH